MNGSREEILFEMALDLPPEKRQRFLEVACRGEETLRQRVERLLTEAHGGGATSLPEEEQEPTRVDDSSEIAEQPGALVGPYRLLEKVGEGGFGTVWAAEQRHPVRRRIALKILKLGMDTKQVVARFEVERQALALMDHPNIAKVLDAGATETGRPYFAMELVRGIPITDYCNQEKLDTKARLDLFIQVCHAIQHAHQKGVIHRDIKPSNILVRLHDGVPVPKVIDFGIAKATQQDLTQKTVYTRLTQFIGTPAYISPEQAEMRGLDIDTRTDIYSLGVLLYELLTGTVPLDAGRLREAGLDQMRTLIRETDPPRPSSKVTTLSAEQQAITARQHATDLPKLVSMIRGDLDWITLKCLEKDRTRRYETANALAMDVARHLANEPVLARPPSPTYLIQKAWRRNKAAYSAAGAVVVALVTGISFSVWQAGQATHARTVAETQRDKANAAKQRADLEARRARQHAYMSDMNLAARAWERGNLLQARRLLAQHEPTPDQEDLRGFEWRLLWGLAHQKNALFNFDMGNRPASSLALSPDGQTLVLAAPDGELHIKDLTTGRERESFRGHAASIPAMAFSPDGRWLATGGERGVIRVWNTGSWTLDGSFAGHTAAVRQIVLLPDESQLLSVAEDHTIRSWDLQERSALNVVALHDTNRIHRISPDGRLVATYGGLTNVVRFRALGPSLRPLAKLPPQGGIILSLRFSSDAKAAVVSVHDSTVTRWELQPLRPARYYWQEVLAEQLALSPDGSVLATAGTDNLIKIWEIASGKQLRVLRGHTATITHLAISQDGRTVVSADQTGQVKVWSTDPEENKDVLLQQGIVVSLAISPDGQTLATSDPNFKDVWLWNLPTRQSSLLFTNRRSEIAFSPDGQWLAFRHFEMQRVELWDRHQNKMLHQFPAGISIGYQLAFSPDSRLLAFRGPEEAIDLWDVHIPERVGRLPGHSSWAVAVAFSPDGELIATAAEGRVRLYHVATQQMLATLSGQDPGTRSICFSPDGQQLVAASGVNEVRRWDVSDPERPQRLEPLRGHTAVVHAAAFSPDGKTIATGSFDSTLKLWDPSLGRELVTLGGHASVIEDLAWSPDGQTLFTGSGDATVRIWSAPSWEEIEAGRDRLDQ